MWAEVGPKRAVYCSRVQRFFTRCAVSGVAGLTISDGGIRHGVLIGD